MVELILGIFLFILIGSFLLERWLAYINVRHSLPDLPEELVDIYDNEEYRKSQLYKKENTVFSIYSSSFSLVIMLLALLSGLFGILDRFLSSSIESYYIVVLLFFGILSFASDLLSIPFDLWDTFKIEETYGFNKTTPRTFILDKLKGWLLMIVIGGALLLLITWLYNVTGKYFWLLAWGAISLFSIVMNMFYSNLIVPLFNKQTPLQDGDLRTAIEAFANKVGYNLKNIFVIDGSKRSSKANAYFSGLGPKKRIVLYDTLINDLTTEEIVAVLAHEIGHYKKKHTLSGLFLGILQTGIMLFLFSLFVGVDEFSQALGGDAASFHIGLIAFSILYSPLSMIIGLLTNGFSRRNEYQADKYASENYNSEPLVSALKKLSKNTLSNLTPHPTYVFFHYSHPTLLQRIKAMRTE
ncbi:MAG: M48 family metallopeptidase [Bacteroidales bacterium]|jgi:STE24 endopeptidase|nr:M48 family metallopeptidase [Bacteroidales bacterium]